VAAAAGAEKLVAVVGDRKIVVVGNSLLEMFDLGIFKFDDSAAVDADKVVMVGSLDHPLVVGLSLSKIVFLYNLSLGKKVQGTVDGGLGDPPVLVAEGFPELISRKVPAGLGGEDFLDDDFAGTGQLQTLALKPILQFTNRRFCHLAPRKRGGIL